MARTKKNKVFDLFKNDFKISFFYKPTMNNDDIFYYIVLDDVIGVRARLFDRILVIVSVVPITSSYVKPLYDKMIDTFMQQSELSVLVSLLGNTSVLHQAIRTHDAPIIEDDRYITVSNEFYTKVKNQFRDSSKHGFYLLSVHDGSSIDEADEEPVSDEYVPKEVPVSQPEPEPEITRSMIDDVKDIIKKHIEDIVIDENEEGRTIFNMTEKDSFSIRIEDNSIYIEDVLSDMESTFNLIKINQLINVFEDFLSITPNVYIMKLTNEIVHGICKGKQYERIDGNNQVMYNKHVQQFIGNNFGSYKIVIRNYN